MLTPRPQAASQHLARDGWALIEGAAPACTRTREQQRASGRSGRSLRPLALRGWPHRTAPAPYALPPAPDGTARKETMNSAVAGGSQRSAGVVHGADDGGRISLLEQFLASRAAPSCWARGHPKKSLLARLGVSGVSAATSLSSSARPKSSSASPSPDSSRPLSGSASIREVPKSA